MTMTLTDAGSFDDGVVTPRADRSQTPHVHRRVQAAISAEYDAADRGDRGAILRRERLYSSHIVEWRKVAEAGAVGALGPKSQDRRDRQRNREVEQLRARAEKAEAELARTKAALDIVGKAHPLLETLSESTDTPKRSQR